jgi:hypothetical protein
MTRQVFLHGVTLSILCVISSYWLIAHLLSVSRDDYLLRGIQAGVATVLVYRYGCDQCKHWLANLFF